MQPSEPVVATAHAREVQAALNHTVSALLPKVLLASGCLVLLLAATAAMHPGPDTPAWASWPPLGTAALLMAAGLYHHRHPVSVQWAHCTAGAATFLLIASAGVRVYASKDAAEATSMILILMSAGGVLLSFPWMLAVVAFASAVWLTLTRLVEPLAAAAELHVAFVATIMGAMLVQLARLHTNKGLARVQMEEAEGRQQLAESLEELRAQDDRFRAMVKNSSDVITLLDARGTIRYQGDSANRVLGYEPSAMVGKDYLAWVHEDDAARTSCALSTLARSPGRPFEIEVRLRRHDGSWAVLESTGVNLLHDPAVNAIVLNSRDVTERRLAEEALRRTEKLRALGMAVAGIAHEVNNPLTASVLNLELMRLELDELQEREDASPAVKEVARKLLRNHDRVLRGTRSAIAVAQRLRSATRLQAGARMPCDVNALAQDVLFLLAHQLTSGVEVKTSFEAKASVSADPHQLSEVLLNLMLNAVDAMAQAPLRTLTLHSFETADRVHILVSDTGTGISPEDLKNLFIPFRTTKTNGTGLGLSISRRLIEEHGGTLTCTSDRGHGTTFHVELPVLQAPAAA